mmetsp:Transcript_34752/g.61158  ORF Transcript_34752/g.61158 Transcript_34752/m.61158 type:complete len:118 (-) Transcript_34752:7-360(-)
MAESLCSKLFGCFMPKRAKVVPNCDAVNTRFDLDISSKLPVSRQPQPGLFGERMRYKPKNKSHPATTILPDGYKSELVERHDMSSHLSSSSRIESSIDVLNSSMELESSNQSVSYTL